MIAARERLDSRYWDQLARELGIRLPYSGYALTTAKATRFLKRLGLTTEQYTVWTAKPFRRNIAKQAETWDYRSWCGLVLESRDLIVSYGCKDDVNE